MPTIVSGTVPASDLALNHSLEALPELLFEVERIVTSGDDALMPMLWVRGSSRAEIEATLEEDPTVDEVTLLGDFDDECLFRMEWVSRIDLIMQMLTNSEATVLDAVGQGDRWKVRVLYPRRSLFSKTHDFCTEHGVEFEVSSIRELDEGPAGRYGLTSAQYEVLSEASRQGYFKVPREVSLSELADDLDISHQAASERLRRATDALVEDTLFVGMAELE
ncbi:MULTISPECIES: helix-turn-helix domain-containing protein [Haloarcula]|uniref:Bacteriocin n=1 Tax=Haloarcula pellucida TaxID=1427151 RepID=A0A830GR11_9EURY|nr:MULTISPECIES: helix-turn-helix domain-containing protein [Halomicroarcula]MBX0350296.1 helix-turn-helix domain-containing protein [Halomicroarcula pellucida]MDS0277602.1 helix-turn-helix domain-containing protein [Halomicroarcula sp. S1AR25-4]QIO22027.1 DNA-binding protein [Haloarcula sp. JP-L23]GGO01406.1 bacteriocin [Halomicroarcula pellucida]